MTLLSAMDFLTKSRIPCVMTDMFVERKKRERRIIMTKKKPGAAYFLREIRNRSSLKRYWTNFILIY